MSTDGTTITPADVAQLNRDVVIRATYFGRIAGDVMIGVGALLFAGFVWAVLRNENVITSSAGSIRFGGDGTMDIVDRVDAVVGSLLLLAYGALSGGLGFALRIVSDFVADRTGATLTGFNVGDAVPPLAESNAESEDE